MPPIKRRMSSSCSKSRQSSYKFMQDDPVAKKVTRRTSLSYKSVDKELEDSYEDCEPVENSKFVVTQIIEKTFPGMIWDAGFVGNENIFVCHGEGVDICDAKLERLINIKVKLPGGAVGLPNGNLIVIDRHSDSINIYEQNGSLIQSYSGGNSPMSVAVNLEQDLIFVTDIHDKCIHKFSLSTGQIEGTIGGSSTDDCKLQWPLYVVAKENGEIMVSDTIKKQVMFFNSTGDFVTSLSLNASSDSRRVQPHGLAFIEDIGLMVVDSLVDSVELFDITGKVHIQTAINYLRDGYKPKVVGASSDGRFLVGGSGGLVKLYNIKPNELYNMKSKRELKPKREQLKKYNQKNPEEADADWKIGRTKQMTGRSTDNLGHEKNCRKSPGTVKHDTKGQLGHSNEICMLSTETVATDSLSSCPIKLSSCRSQINMETKYGSQDDDCIVIDDDDYDIDTALRRDMGKPMNLLCFNPASDEQHDRISATDSSSSELFVVCDKTTLNEALKSLDTVDSKIEENVIVLDDDDDDDGD